MGIKTVPHLPYSPDLAPCDFWLFPKLRGCHYKTIEEMKETVMKVIDRLTQEDFHGAFQKLLEWYNSTFATGLVGMHLAAASIWVVTKFRCVLKSIKLVSYSY